MLFFDLPPLDFVFGRFLAYMGPWMTFRAKFGALLLCNVNLFAQGSLRLPEAQGPAARAGKCSFLTRRRSISFFVVFRLIWALGWLSGRILELLCNVS